MVKHDRSAPGARPDPEKWVRDEVISSKKTSEDKSSCLIQSFHSVSRYVNDPSSCHIRVRGQSDSHQTPQRVSLKYSSRFHSYEFTQWPPALTSVVICGETSGWFQSLSKTSGTLGVCQDFSRFDSYHFNFNGSVCSVSFSTETIQSQIVQSSPEDISKLSVHLLLVSSPEVVFIRDQTDPEEISEAQRCHFHPESSGHLKKVIADASVNKWFFQLFPLFRVTLTWDLPQSDDQTHTCQSNIVLHTILTHQ